jgi:hypothetical protein
MGEGEEGREREIEREEEDGEVVGGWGGTLGDGERWGEGGEKGGGTGAGEVGGTGRGSSEPYLGSKVSSDLTIY